MLCWVYVVDGVQAGRCAASAATAWAPSMKEVKRKMGVMDYHHWKLSPKLGSAAEVACHLVTDCQTILRATD